MTAVDGLFVIGMPWLYTWGSGRFLNVGRDADHLVDRIDDYLATVMTAEASSVAVPV